RSKSSEIRIVGLPKSGDKKQNEIAKLLGVSPKYVSSTKKRYEETGSVSDRSRLERLEKILYLVIKNSPLISKTQGVRINISCVNRDLIDQLIIDPELQNGGGSAGIWRCISYKDTGICNIYTGRINQFVNINTLENNLLSSVELLFESNDPWHTV
ncbi:hypothetical protein BpHYR1_007016, partial [Brachionus plicatilis]